MERRQDTFVEANTKIGGLIVQKDWLKASQTIEDYRAYMYGAFEKAQLRYQLRRQKKTQLREDQKKLIDQIETPNTQYYQELRRQMVEEDPVLPNMVQERMKLTKISRNCSKKFIERYFNINEQTDSMVYYKNENDDKPKKTVALDDCRIDVESFRRHQGLEQSIKSQKATLWGEDDKPFRVQIRLKHRKYQPAYIYTDSLHQAVCIKANIEYLLKNSQAQHMGALIAQASQMYKMRVIENVQQRLIQMKLKRQHLQNTQTQFVKIERAFHEQRVETVSYIMKEIERVKLLEASMPPEEEPIPQIWSTFKQGQIQKFNPFYIKAYQQIQKRGHIVADFAKQRKKARHPVIQDLIRQKMQDRYFSLTNGQYKVNDQILDNLVSYSQQYVQGRLGDVPFLINDINGISQVQLEGETIIIYDKRKNEYHLPINEICYVATDIGYRQEESGKPWRLQLRGRKINPNVENIGDNIFPYQLGLERFKQSRLSSKTVLKVSLKNFQLPLRFQNDLKKQILSKDDRILYRFKFEVGEYSCYSTLFQMQDGTSTIELKEDLIIDLLDKQYFKITLIAIKGRQLPHNQCVNEFVNEQIISFVNVKVRDLESNNLIHELNLDRQFYVPNKEGQRSQDDILVTAALLIQEAPGSMVSVEMEGNQLLVGRYVVFQKQILAKVLKVNRNNTASILLIDDQPKAKFYPQKLIENVNIKQDLTLIERYGVSIFNLASLPKNYEMGQFEWTLDLQIQNNESALLSKLNSMITTSQVKQQYSQRLQGFVKKAKNQTFVCGRLQISIMNAQNLANPDNDLCDAFIQVSVQDTKKQSGARFMDIANERSFILCKKNSEEVIHKNFKTSIVKQSNNPSWVSTQHPQGEVFELGMFMKRYPHFILIEVYHQRKKKGLFSSETTNELIGFAELATEDLIQIDNYGQEFYLFLEDSLNRSSLVKIRSLFVPTPGTIERLNLDTRKVLFKNAQQYLFYKILHLNSVHDEYGYKVPLGKYLIDFQQSNDETLMNIMNKVKSTSVNYSLIQDVAQFSQRYERFSPEHKKHRALREDNPYRPLSEENVYYFKQLWLYTQFVNRNKALNERQRVFWEEYMEEVSKAGEEGAMMDDELKSIRSKLTNTTKMISSKYRRRSLAHKTQNPTNKQEEQDQRGKRFSVLFIGQWEKEKSWKYVDIWHLVKLGIPADMRVALWKDLLRRSINEQQVYVYFMKSPEYKDIYNPGMSMYDNLKIIASTRDSLFNEQIELDIRDFKHPAEYLKSQPNVRDEKIEEERYQMFEIFRVYGLWANEFCVKRKKIFGKIILFNQIVYYQGLISIVQRMLTFMNEEDAFWSLVGIAKAFSNVFTFDFKEMDQKKSPSVSEYKLQQYQLYSPLLSRKTLFKNEFNILKCLLKLHFPLVHDHLKALGAPLEYYFFDCFTQFFTNTFSSEIVLRLWDMMIFNLSTNTIEFRKRALWYLLAVPLYMVQLNLESIMKSQNPIQVKALLNEKTPSFNYNPNLFIDELLSIIRQIFVIKDSVMNKLLKNDMSYQLETMRKQLEYDFSQKAGESLQRGRDLAKYLVGKGAELKLNQDKFNSLVAQQDVTIQLSVLGFRNLFDSQDEKESVALQIAVNGDENINSEVFNIALPNSYEQSLLQMLPKPIVMQTKQQYTQGKKLTIKVTQINNGIHQISKGSSILTLEQYIDSPLEQHLTLKLFNEGRNKSYIDLKLQIIPGRSQSIYQINSANISHINNDLLNSDFLSKDKDDEVKRQLRLQQLKEWGLNELQRQKVKGRVQDLIKVDKEINDDNLLNQVTQIIRGFGYVIDDFDLSKETNQTQVILKALNHGQYVHLRELTQQFFTLNSVKTLQDRITIGAVAQFLNHAYAAINYPIALQECSMMVSLILNQQCSFISRVTQSLASDNSLQEVGLFGKLFKPSQQQSTFDVSDQFKFTLNSVLRITGLSYNLDFNLPPFNSLNFWLKTNNIKKATQILNVSLCLPNGDQALYRFRFDQNGTFEKSPNTHSVLPIGLYDSRVISQTEFSQLIEHLPIISECYRQEIFLRDQIWGSQEVYVDSASLFKVTFQALNKRFVFSFDPKLDKQDDFTIDPSQLLRISKGDISQVYKRVKEVGGQETYQVRLACLSRQDTFMTVKRRIKQFLDFIIQSENLRDSVPNVLSQKFQFRRLYMQGDSLYYPSMSRICNETSPKDTQFELVRIQEQVEDKEDQDYGSYGLYHHPSGFKEWRPCKIIMKVPGQEEKYRVEYQHEKGEKITYTLKREDILLSYEYKRNQESYYKEEVQGLLDKLDEEELEIAQMLKEEDRKGLHGGLDDIKRQLQFEDEGLKIGHQQLDEGYDHEAREIMEELSLDDQ